jgi:hypothetical protein
VEDLHNLMLARNSNEFSDVADSCTIGRAALSNANWASIINGANDDALVSPLRPYSNTSNTHLLSKYP